MKSNIFNALKQKQIKKRELYRHETKRYVLFRFLGVLFVVIAYLFLMSLRYGIEQGFSITILTWSFFVFCTPIADAGLLLAFPLRLLIRIRMVYVQIFVWIVAFFFTTYSFFFRPEIFSKTFLLDLFHHILAQPFPFYAIILISGVGTFLSIYFGDELMDVMKHKERKKHAKHKNKYRIILTIFILAIIVVLYDHLLQNLGINIKSF